jgi:hypothetical protein
MVQAIANVYINVGSGMDLFASLFYCTLEELPVRCRVNQ